MSLAIETFTENVRQFCQWVESSKHDIQTVRQLLLALMQGITYLTVSDTEDANEHEYPRRDYDQWSLDYKRLADFPLQYYREVFALCDLNEEPPVTGDAHDDLADIYGDLWHGLQALNNGDAFTPSNIGASPIFSIGATMLRPRFMPLTSITEKIGARMQRQPNSSQCLQ